MLIYSQFMGEVSTDDHFAAALCVIVIGITLVLFFLQRYLGSPVLVKLYRNRDGRKEFAGYLKAYDEATGAVTVTVGNQELTFEKKDVALVRLRVEF